jgi:branched-chain amino acid transport system substrate-binding protein
MKPSLVPLLILGPCVLALAACGDEEAPDKIVFGQATALSGPMEAVNISTTHPVYTLWMEEVNERGGLYIRKYDKRIPVELLQYDDESDVKKSKKLMEKLILEDKVDFLFPPVGTDFLLAAAPIANKYGYVLVGGAGGAQELKEIISGLPYFFSTMPFSDTQMPALADLLKELGVKRAGILLAENEHGVEYTAVLTPLLPLKGIDLVLLASYAEDDPDLPETLAEIMTEAEALDVEAFIGFTYPNGTFTLLPTAMEIGYNPKLLHLSVGLIWSTYLDMFGAEVVEGMVAPGAWNSKSSDGAKEFEEKFLERWGDDEEIPVDYWGHLPYWAGCQFFEQAIEKAGTLEQDKIREVMATETFDTDMGPVKFENGMMVGYVGQVGQWQDGVFEVIGPENQRTADPIYPKPEWPAPPDGGDSSDGADGAAGAGNDAGDGAAGAGGTQ